MYQNIAVLSPSIVGLRNRAAAAIAAAAAAAEDQADVMN